MSAPIQIVDEDDNPIGQATKQEAWAKGLRHRIIRIMIENDDGKLLLQHRSPTKDIFPNCWDNSSAGHVDVGEDYLTAATRELTEEIGITNAQLQKVGFYDSDETWKDHRFKRFTQVYRLRYNTTPQKLETGKVDGVQWFTLDEIKTLIKEHPDKVTDGLRQVIDKYYSK
ncbi:MAG TPA: NUDIX domain-containing protein [Patescibacteria group bacterium]|jgi:isopentenyl-diphosphate delta-isomerase|nr:NUDIX domain-containing protein [Patescibacteria group bacterium]